jgi:hypothetical protein
MKRIIFSLFFFAFIVIFSLSLFHRQLIKTVAVNQLKSIFPGSEISVADARLSPLKELALFDIRIKKDKAYEFKLKEAGVIFSLQSLLKKRILTFYIKGAAIRIDLGSNSISDLPKHINLSGPSLFLANGLEVSDLSLDLRSKEMSLEAGLSLALDLLKQELRYCDIRISVLDSLGAHAQNMVFKVKNGAAAGGLSIRQLNYDKAKIEEVSSEVFLKGKEVSFPDLRARLFGGIVRSEVQLFLGAEFVYAAQAEFSGLDIERFIKDFKLEEKISMTGKLSGSLSLKGKGAKILFIDGNFSAGPGGGTMAVKDEEMLKNMAGSADQPLDILVESFKDYHYNTGVMKMGLVQDDLSLDIALDGEKGKRNLTVTLHDFKLK